MNYEEKTRAAELKLGKAITEADVFCPMCGDQPLSCDGEDASWLFCPHCELTMQVCIKLSWRHHDRKETATTTLHKCPDTSCGRQSWIPSVDKRPRRCTCGHRMVPQ